MPLLNYVTHLSPVPFASFICFALSADSSVVAALKSSSSDSSKFRLLFPSRGIATISTPSRNKSYNLSTVALFRYLRERQTEIERERYIYIWTLLRTLRTVLHCHRQPSRQRRDFEASSKLKYALSQRATLSRLFP